MIPVGSPAPLFTLPASDGGNFRLADYRGRSNVLLLFLPAAFTPICSTELPTLALLGPQFRSEADTVVAGVTVDNTHSNAAWQARCGAKDVALLSDFYPHGAVSQAYGAWIPAEGISDRATVLVGKDGLVKYAASAGKFGRRSIRDLLAIATRVNGGVPAPAEAVRRPLGIPTLFVTSTCPHCRRVLHELRARGLADRVVVRVVDQDRDAMQALYDVGRTESVPTLVGVGPDPSIGVTSVLAAFDVLPAMPAYAQT